MSKRDELVMKLKNAIIEADFDGAPKITKEALQAGVKADVLMERRSARG